MRLGLENSLRIRSTSCAFSNSANARVNLIRKTLWQELPNSYDVSDIQTYQKKIYEYVYMRYPEVA